MASELIAEAITDYLGCRCPDHDDNCFTCQAWAEYDRLYSHPAPAATDTGLVTGLWLRPIGPHAYATTKDRSTADDWEKYVKVEEYVTRSQAEELLAAKDVRIKELDRCHEGTIDLCNQKTAQIEALEAKLAAAEKALEPFVTFFNEAMKGFSEGYAERTPSDKPVLGWNNAYLLMRHFIEARAVLGGEQS